MLNRIYEMVTEQGNALARLEANQESMRGEILGNGQPGRVQRIEERLDVAETERLGLKKKVDYLSGVAATVAFLLSCAEAWLHGRAR